MEIPPNRERGFVGVKTHIKKLSENQEEKQTERAIKVLQQIQYHYKCIERLEEKYNELKKVK